MSENVAAAGFGGFGGGDELGQVLRSLEAEMQLHGEMLGLTSGCFRQCVNTITNSDMLSDGEALCVYNCFGRTMEAYTVVANAVRDEALEQQMRQLQAEQAHS